MILAALAVGLGLWLAVAAAHGDLDGGGSRAGTQAGAAGIPPGGWAGWTSDPGLIPGHSYPRVPVRERTHPRLTPAVGGRNTAFSLRFRRRRNLGPHGRAWGYYGVIVSPVAQTPRQGCYGFGRYVMRGRKGQLARVALHPRRREWCRGDFEVSVYRASRAYCSPRELRRHPCSTASYLAVPTGSAYFRVR